MATARAEIGRLQRRLWERQRALIEASVVAKDAAFRRYEQRYLRATRSWLREAGYGEVLDSVDRADAVFVGDYHTLKQSQRSFLKLLRRRQSRRPLIVGLEFVQGRHQAALDAWMAGRLGDASFLRAIDYARHAVFETWENFRPLLEEVRQKRLRVVGLDRLGSRGVLLEERDDYAARRLVQELSRTPAAQALVLVGQLHVAPPHLPASVQREAARRGLPAPSTLVVYQNCERIWWGLQREGRELDVEAVVIRPGELCLLNTPPVVVQQSFLDWVEGGAQPLEGSHPEERFRVLARAIARFLGIDGPAVREALERVQVFTSRDLSFVSRLARLGFSAREVRQIRRQVLARESYYIPRAHLAYLANLSVNHAAEEATHFLRHVVSGADDEPRGLVDAFYARALEEAYAFCGSKIINPRRKCPHEPELERLRRVGDRFVRDVARLVLHHRAVERGERGFASLRGLHGAKDGELFNAVTHTLGYMLGERLYLALATGRMVKREVRKLFLDPLAEEGEALATYLSLSQRLRDVRVPARS